MLSQFFKKILCGLVIITMVSGAYLPMVLQPKEVRAQTASVEVGPNLVQSILNQISSAGSYVYSGLQTAIQYSLQLKEFTLDAIAYAIAKQVLRQLTTSIVNWINSGFEGNPAFVTDPAGFFSDLGGEIIGDIVSRNGDLKFLCSPFAINVQLSLRLRYGSFRKRVSCTLNDIIKNSTAAIKGASINGFTAGDFKQGGWPAFVSMTTEPQNNVYGASLLAQSEVEARISGLQAQKRDDLNQGRGFLSWQKCTKGPKQDSSNSIGSDGRSQQEIDYMNAVGGSGGSYNSNDYVTTCETQTPGSVIAGTLDTTLGSPIRELELADELNEIINALFGQLVTTVLSGGLKAASGNGSGDKNSYTSRLENQPEDQRLVKSIVTTISKGIDRYIAQEESYALQKTLNLSYMLSIKKPYDDAIMCYQSKIASSTSLASQEVGYARLQIATINSALEAPQGEDVFGTTTSILMTTTNLLADINASESILAQLNQIKEKVSSTLTVASSSELSTLYSDLIDNNQVHGPSDVARAKQDEKENKRTFKDLKSPGEFYYRNCQSLTP